MKLNMAANELQVGDRILVAISNSSEVSASFTLEIEY